jgi:hypothetical protein
MNSLKSKIAARLGLRGSAVALVVIIFQTATMAAENYSGWGLNLTPVIVAGKKGHDLGGGADPEVKYTLDMGGPRLSAGLRIGVYYAQNQVGIISSPTMRLTVPVGALEPYAALGMGYGWIPEKGEDGIATMSRAGIVYRFKPNLAIGLEGTAQRIEGTNFSFPSIGSMVAFNL